MKGKIMEGQHCVLWSEKWSVWNRSSEKWERWYLKGGRNLDDIWTEILVAFALVVKKKRGHVTSVTSVNMSVCISWWSPLEGFSMKFDIGDFYEINWDDRSFVEIGVGKKNFGHFTWRRTFFLFFARDINSSWKLSFRVKWYTGVLISP
jgi:hypothetical protein